MLLTHNRVKDPGSCVGKSRQGQWGESEEQSELLLCGASEHADIQQGAPGWGHLTWGRVFFSRATADADPEQNN